ncbi:2-keto-4-pentenoate hydratase/2-oxohepta-3-ene-1,7-dioic acid hydratase (catechol pathway) [Micromonospora eburnea]|uniref:2-keto-4-pentenoate hydratase/2-oxohepta-3-ene-1,7-dioic acid hydratase (Catechol pathway) n=1 Tax=Micromonospora eburnea TaxID=227316 RepID=A0A1C6UJ30_9ACTN|nr:fumarylacetoacetate hydrolase family protein [Micromonospora eburnea]SCL53863.1 2-keto-4-pentenoate hydratase/2-oxohepta-3-ene-1,7-dioic acid hydratase (catechol pathway) [Micromonospora eburnea]
MRFLRVGPVGGERPVLLTDDDTHFDLRPLTDDIDGGFLAADGVQRTRRALDAGELPATSISGERIGAPLANPGAVLCIGMNYAEHAAESGAEPPEHPVLFFKTPNTVVGPNDDVLLPPGAEKVDWEVELAVVIGRRARYLDSPADAPGVIAGYALANDVSERAYQLDVSGGQWSKGKCAETFNPLGPWLATADHVGDPQALRMRSWVNDEPRQDSSSKDMIFGVYELVWSLSQYMVLEPGYVINTGTPQGVALSGRFPYLDEGDTIRMEIDRLGSMTQRVRRATR